jgi:hypothetical protein
MILERGTGTGAIGAPAPVCACASCVSWVGMGAVSG